MKHRSRTLLPPGGEFEENEDPIVAWQQVLGSLPATLVEQNATHVSVSSLDQETGQIVYATFSLVPDQEKLIHLQQAMGVVFDSWEIEDDNKGKGPCSCGVCQECDWARTHE